MLGIFCPCLLQYNSFWCLNSSSLRGGLCDASRVIEKMLDNDCWLRHGMFPGSWNWTHHTRRLNCWGEVHLRLKRWRTVCKFLCTFPFSAASYASSSNSRRIPLQFSPVNFTAGHLVESVQLPFCCKGAVNHTSSAQSRDRFPLSRLPFSGKEQWPIAGVLHPAHSAWPQEKPRIRCFHGLVQRVTRIY